MYCPNCGKEDVFNGENCMYCGAPLIDNQNFPDETFSEKFTHFSRFSNVSGSFTAVGATVGSFLRKHWKKFIPIAAVILVILIGCSLLSSLVSPERVVKNYFKAVMNANAGQAYANVDYVRSDLTGRNEFEEYWTQHYTKQEVNGSEIKDTTDDEQTLTREYVITYYLSGSNSPNYMDITLVKSNQKRFLFFDKYTVVPDFIVTNFTIVTPADSVVSLNDTELTGEESGDGICTYTIPSLFDQTYDLTISTETTGDYETEIMPEDNGVYKADELEYGSNMCDQMYTDASEQLKSIISSAIEDQDFPDDIETLSDGDVLQSYDNLREDFSGDDNYTIYTEFMVYYLTNESYTQYYDTDNPEYLCEISFSYDYVKATRDDLSGTYYESDSDSSSGRAEMQYNYEDGQWKLADFNINY